MENFEENHVYHGAPQEFDSDRAIPRRSIRTRVVEGKQEVIFDEEAFHATPYKWIALSYAYTPTEREIEGETAHYYASVGLYEDTKTVVIFGFDSLEESLKVLYGNGGYVYHFDKDKFIYKEGLGNLEVVVNEPTKPVTVERVDDPVEEMKKLGVTFEFVDLSLPENEKHRG